MDTQPKRTMSTEMLPHSPKAKLILIAAVAFLGGVYAEKRFTLSDYISKVPLIGGLFA